MLIKTMLFHLFPCTQTATGFKHLLSFLHPFHRHTRSAMWAIPRLVVLIGLAAFGTPRLAVSFNQATVSHWCILYKAVWIESSLFRMIRIFKNNRHSVSPAVRVSVTVERNKNSVCVFHCLFAPIFCDPQAGQNFHLLLPAFTSSVIEYNVPQCLHST